MLKHPIRMGAKGAFGLCFRPAEKAVRKGCAFRVSITAIEWFDIDGLGKSPSRVDFDKMRNMNAQYLRKCDNAVLAEMIFAHYNGKLSDISKTAITKAIESMKPRAELVTDLYKRWRTRRYC